MSYSAKSVKLVEGGGQCTTDHKINPMHTHILHYTRAHTHTTTTHNQYPVVNFQKSGRRTVPRV